MQSKITCYTVITGDKDTIIEGQVKGNADFVLFTDQTWFSKTWTMRKSKDVFTDPRRDSRIQKMLPHQFFDTEYSIYIDGNIRLLTAPEKLVERYLKNHDLAVFRHPNRDCLYEEAKTCAVMKLDDPEVIIEQAKKYEDEGFAKHKGLAECGIILRRHTPKVEQFNNAWFSEYCRHSRRDQISFPYAVDKSAIRVNIIDDFFIEQSPTLARKQSGDFEIVLHNHQK